mmetsp:Transcript_14863/g.47528  ORF Transcript_14863/g.47528 Transcript_14863/m.47528 type:complete len:193 (+) Transcript_14863:67-645(+)
MAATSRPKLLAGRKVLILADFQFEDLELMYPKMRLEEEGAEVSVMGAHPAGMKYTGKYGYAVKSDLCVDNVSTTDAVASYDALLIPGGFAPDYMRRNQAMLDLTVAMAGAGRVVASICHGPWMLCSARRTDGSPLAKGIRATCFSACKDDLINAGATYVDEPAVVDGPFITARTPADLTPFLHAIIDEMAKY